jgi:hypothetical protein
MEGDCAAVRPRRWRRFVIFFASIAVLPAAKKKGS